MILIYTGYAWRPIKPEEEAIMCVERVLPYKTKDPIAGDLAEVTEDGDNDSYYIS